MKHYVLRTISPDPYKLYASDSMSDMLDFIDQMLEAITHFSLLSKLNDIQSYCGGQDEGSVFYNKATIPLIIINLVLKEYGIEIVEN